MTNHKPQFSWDSDIFPEPLVTKEPFNQFQLVNGARGFPRTVQHQISWYRGNLSSSSRIKEKNILCIHAKPLSHLLLCIKKSFLHLPLADWLRRCSTRDGFLSPSAALGLMSWACYSLPQLPVSIPVTSVMKCLVVQWCQAIRHADIR